MSWHRFAACRDTDPEVFFRARDRDRALAICGVCPYVKECVEEDLTDSWKADNIHGIRGGLTEEQRRAMYRARYPRQRVAEAARYYDLAPA